MGTPEAGGQGHSCEIYIAEGKHNAVATAIYGVADSTSSRPSGTDRATDSIPSGHLQLPVCTAASPPFQGCLPRPPADY